MSSRKMRIFCGTLVSKGLAALKMGFPLEFTPHQMRDGNDGLSKTTKKGRILLRP